MFERFPDLLSIGDMQDALGIDRSLAYGLVNSGDIKHIRIGKLIKIPKIFLIDFVAEECYNDSVTTGNSSCHNSEEVA